MPVRWSICYLGLKWDISCATSWYRRLLKFSQSAERLKKDKRRMACLSLPTLTIGATCGIIAWDERRQRFKNPRQTGRWTWHRDAKTKAINSLTTLDKTDHIISTAHKAKGWNGHGCRLTMILLWCDFSGGKNLPEELRLLYVACTRAKVNLDIFNIQDLIHGLKDKKVIYG